MIFFRYQNVTFIRIFTDCFGFRLDVKHATRCDFVQGEALVKLSSLPALAEKTEREK